MSESPPTTAPDETYRPISGLALAGLIVSLLFAGLIAVSLVAGIMKGTPIFFPIGIVLVAVAGFGLSFAGFRQIQASEGTRVGVGIARLGMGLAVVAGLGYAAYVMSIGLAVGVQADTFLAGELGPDTGFLRRLQSYPKDSSAIDQAFLLTKDPGMRGGARPSDEVAFRRVHDAPLSPDGQGELSIFRNNIMVRLLSRGGTIESLGMRDWEHDKASYRVARNYKLETPEATLTVVLLAESAEGETEGQLRRWRVNFLRSGIETTTLTPLGMGVQELREQGRHWLEAPWLSAVRAGKILARKLDQSNWENLTRHLPNAKAESLGARRAFLAALETAPTELSSLGFPMDSRSWPIWNRDEGGRLWIRENFSGHGLAAGTMVQFDGWMKIRSTEPMPLEKMTPPLPHIDWDVESITVERVKALKGG